MTEQARIQRNAYMREYRKNNKEKIKAIQSKYWGNKGLEEDIANGLITPGVDIEEFEKLSNEDNEKSIKAEDEEANRYCEKYFNKSKNRGDEQ